MINCIVYSILFNISVIICFLTSWYNSDDDDMCIQYTLNLHQGFPHITNPTISMIVEVLALKWL